MKKIAIVGAGFSGVALAWNLLQRLDGSVRVILFNKEPNVGRGLAFGTPSPHHLLNVPAGRMGVNPGDEGGFLRYLRQLGLPFQSGDFVPRSLYGSYLEHSLGEQRAAAKDRGVELLIQQATVADITPLGGGRHKLFFSDGQWLEVDAAVLALGNFAPVSPKIVNGPSWSAPGLQVTPWSLRDVNSIHPRAPVLLIGSGLTAFDVVLQLRHQGHRGVITMLSRRGLLAQSHRQLESAPAQGLVPDDFLEGIKSVPAMLRRTRALIREAQATGHDWRDVIGGLRQSTVRLWQQLPLSERQRFIRHLLPYWDTHRHRAAVPIASAIGREIDAGTLRPVAGRLRSLVRVGALWTASIELRNSATEQAWSGDVVINCSGPSSDLRAAKSETLIQNLLNNDRLLPDPLSLGVLVDTQYRLLDGLGCAQDGLFYLGPMLKAQFWEATAVPELRVHALRICELLSMLLYAEN